MPKHYDFLKIVKIIHVSIWKWIVKSQNLRKYLRNKKIQKYIIDETIIKVGSKLIWIWIVMESSHNEILSFHIFTERNMFGVERILSQVVNKYGLHSVSSSDGGTWYPQACKFLKIQSSSFIPLSRKA